MYDTDINNCNGLWHGLKSTYELDAQSETLIWVASMTHGRWYPTTVTLPDGKVLVVNGMDEFGKPNLLIEIYDPASKTWVKNFDPGTSRTYCVGAGSPACTGSGSPCYGGFGAGVAPSIGNYPRMHLMPNGLVITCGIQSTVPSCDPMTGRWAVLTQISAYRHYGASFFAASSQRGGKTY